MSEKLEGDLEESNETIDHLKTELAKKEVGLEHGWYIRISCLGGDWFCLYVRGASCNFIFLVSVMAEQREEIEVEFREQLAEYDRKLSDAKREQTKSG